MRTAISFCCLLAIGLSGYGLQSKPSEFADAENGLFSIQMNIPQPNESGILIRSGSPVNSSSSVMTSETHNENLLEKSMNLLVSEQQNNGRGVERIRYVF